MESSLTMPESSASGRTLSNTPSLMETLLGLLRARVKRWIELAGRDVHSSDPYVVVKLGPQTMYDHDMFSEDDKMGSNAEFEIKTFIEALQIVLDDLPSGHHHNKDSALQR